MVVWKTLCGNVCQDVSPLSRKRKHGSNLYSLQSGPPLLKENIGFQIIVRSCEQKKNCPAVEDPQGDLQNNCNQMGLNIIIVRVLEREKSSPNHCSVVQAFIIQAFLSQLAELSRSEFDPELFSHSAYNKFFVTFATKVPYLTFYNKMRQLLI